MKAFGRSVLATSVMFDNLTSLGSTSSLALMLMCHVAGANQISSQGRILAHNSQAKSLMPVSISLSLDRYWNTRNTDVPGVTVTFTNSGPHRLEFSLSSPLSSFTVEYKAAATRGKPDANWTTLRPYSQAPPNADTPGKPAATQTYSVLSEVPAHSQGENEYDLFDFPMTKEGFYRITAVVSIPDVAELTGPVNAPTLVRKFDLSLRSNSVIVRRTATGFVEVPAAADKQAPAK